MAAMQGRCPRIWAVLQAGWVPGTSLLLDLAFPAFPDNMGHWMEALLPVYNVLEQGAWKRPLSGGSGFIDTIIFVNLRRKHLAVSHILRCQHQISPFALWLRGVIPSQ